LPRGSATPRPWPPSLIDPILALGEGNPFLQKKKEELVAAHLAGRVIPPVLFPTSILGLDKHPPGLDVATIQCSASLLPWGASPSMELLTSCPPNADEEVGWRRRFAPPVPSDAPLLVGTATPTPNLYPATHSSARRSSNARTCAAAARIGSNRRVAEAVEGQNPPRCSLERETAPVSGAFPPWTERGDREARLCAPNSPASETRPRKPSAPACRQLLGHLERDVRASGERRGTRRSGTSGDRMLQPAELASGQKPVGYQRASTWGNAAPSIVLPPQGGGVGGVASVWGATCGFWPPEASRTEFDRAASPCLSDE